MQPKVLTIGSCRLATPVSQMRARYGFLLLNKYTYGFTHSTTDALQELRWLGGEIEISEELWPCVSAQPYRATSGFSGPVDATVVEISNVMPLLYKDYALHRSKTMGLFADVPKALDVFRQNARAEQRKLRRELLEALPEFATLDTFRRDLLLQASINMQSTTQTRDEILKIRDRLPKHHLFISHCSPGSGHGLAMQSRELAIHRIRNICATESIPFYDPSPDMAFWGAERGFAKEGKDLQHYADDFITHIGETICTKLWPEYSGKDAYNGPGFMNDPKTISDALGRMSVTLDPDAVLKLADRLIRLDSKSTLAWKMRARTLIVKKNFSEAAQAWDHALSRAPNDVSLLIEAADCAVLAKDVTRGQSFMAQVLALDPENQIGNSTAIEVDLLAGKAQQAIDRVTVLARHRQGACFQMLDRALDQNKTQVAAILYRSLAALGTLDVRSQAQAIHTQAMWASVKAFKEKNWAAEAGHLQAALLVTPTDDPAAAKILSRASTALRVCRTDGDSSALDRLEALMSLVCLSPRLLASVADVFAKAGRHTVAGALVARALRSGDDEQKKPVLALARREITSAIDTHADHADVYLEALLRDAADHPITRKMYILLLRSRLAQLKAGVLAARAAPPSQDAEVDLAKLARSIVKFDPENLAALRAIATTPVHGEPPPDLKKNLETLLHLAPNAWRLVLASARKAFADEQHAAALLYYDVLSGQVSSEAEKRRAAILKARVKAMRALATQEDDEAMASVLAVLELDNANSLALSTGARMLLRRHEYDEALALLRRLDSIAADVARTKVLIDMCERKIALKNRSKVAA